jgi:hypothetical protein
MKGNGWRRGASATPSIVDRFDLSPRTLTPGLVGAASVALRLPVHIVETRIGAYVNLLAPITFYAMAECV